MLNIDAITLNFSEDRYFYEAQMETGSFTAVVGPSGGGKSTLISVIAGFLSPVSGRITFQGQPISHLPPEARPLSVLFQDHNLFPHMSVFQNVGIGLSPSLSLSEPQRREVNIALEKVGLSGFEKRMPHALSGGQRQRCAIARALVRNQPLLLLDEPFSALDPGTRLQMLSLIDDLRKTEKKTVLMVSHQPSDMAKVADRILFLSDGKIGKSYAADEFFDIKDDPDITRYLYGEHGI